MIGNTKKNLNIPGLAKLRSIGSNLSELKERVNDLQLEKVQLREKLTEETRITLDKKQDEINAVIKEVEDIERINKR
jgi:regulator of replication initiation timing